MKRSFDNFLTSSSYEYTPIASSTANNASQVSLGRLHSIPNEIILHIFTYLSISTLCQLSLVSKSIRNCARNNFLWQNIAESILFPHEIASKLDNVSEIDYCKSLLMRTKVGKQFLSGRQHILQGRDSTFVDRLKYLQIPNYQLLSPLEAQALIKQEDTTKFIKIVSFQDYKGANLSLSFHHIAQQKVMTGQFYFLNCTPHVVSVSSNLSLLINNKLIANFANPYAINVVPDKSQYLILIIEDNFCIYHSYMDDTNSNPGQLVTKIYCKENELNQDNLQIIQWDAAFFQKTSTTC